MRHQPRKRRARVLLAASGLAATLTVSACTENSTGPFGNLKAPDCDLGATFCPPGPDMAVPPPDGPFGNLKAPDCDLGPSPYCPPKDGG